MKKNPYNSKTPRINKPKIDSNKSMYENNKKNIYSGEKKKSSRNNQMFS